MWVLLYSQCWIIWLYSVSVLQTSKIWIIHKIQMCISLDTLVWYSYWNIWFLLQNKFFTIQNRILCNIIFKSHCMQSQGQLIAKYCYSLKYVTINTVYLNKFYISKKKCIQHLFQSENNYNMAIIKIYWIGQIKVIASDAIGLQGWDVEHVVNEISFSFSFCIFTYCVMIRRRKWSEVSQNMVRNVSSYMSLVQRVLIMS